MPRWVPVFMASAAAKTSIYIWSELHLINILISVLSHLLGEKINSVNLCYAKAWEANILFVNCLCSRQQSSGSWHERLKWLARAQFSRYSHADWHRRGRENLWGRGRRWQLTTPYAMVSLYILISGYMLTRYQRKVLHCSLFLRAFLSEMSPMSIPESWI